MERRYYSLKAGSIKNLRIEKGRLEEPAPDEIQVEVKAIGLNFADIFAIWGLYSATPTGSFTPGPPEHDDEDYYETMWYVLQQLSTPELDGAITPAKVMAHLAELEKFTWCLGIRAISRLHSRIQE